MKPKKQPKRKGVTYTTWYRYDPIHLIIKPRLKAIWQILRHGRLEFKIRADKKEIVAKKINYWLEKYA